MVSRDRRGAERRGRRAERYAALWLQLRGYKLLESRFKCRVGEVDLIMRRGQTLVFVEVKQRPVLSQALIAVTAKNWARISMAAEVWAAQHPKAANMDWRYDLVAITPRSFPKHYRDFWRP
ncbi:MAG: YraN family protein [Henriciella sp.]|nr:YraN family protein [Henriciella sp.]